MHTWKKYEDILKYRIYYYPRSSADAKDIVVDTKRKIAGTIDFIAITPAGKVNVLDWKFMDLDTDKYEDIPWYKVEAWRIQMGKYKDIVATNYNVKSQDFDQTRLSAGLHPRL